jgi:hypothetical protein
MPLPVPQDPQKQAQLHAQEEHRRKLWREEVIGRIMNEAREIINEG